MNAALVFPNKLIITRTLACCSFAKQNSKTRLQSIDYSEHY